MLFSAILFLQNWINEIKNNNNNIQFRNWQYRAYKITLQQKTKCESMYATTKRTRHVTPFTFLIASHDAPITAIRDAWTRILKNIYIYIYYRDCWGGFTFCRSAKKLKQLKQLYVLAVEGLL